MTICHVALLKMFALKSSPRLRLFSSKFVQPVRNCGSYIKFENKHINLNGDGLIKACKGVFKLSFAGLFTANTCAGIYMTTVIEKPYGDNCPLRNIIVGLVHGALFGCIKGITYSFGNVFFWLNAWYEHQHSTIVDTEFGKMRERDIRFHLIPGANNIKTGMTDRYNNSYFYTCQEIKDYATLLKHLGVLDDGTSTIRDY